MSLHFIRPEWFLALLPVSLLLWHLARKQHTSTDWQSYIAPHLVATLVSGQSPKARKSSLWFIGLSLLIAITALAGPAFNKVPLPVFASSAARVLVMDMSISMYATDMVPNRLTQAKFRATDMINQISEGDTALVAYAGDAFVISPLTRDKNTLLNLLPSLSPDIMPALGSAPGEGIKQAIELLTHSGHLSGDIVLMTDGLDDVDEADIRRAMKDSPFRLAIYGFGTAQGAPMKLPNGSFVRGNDNALVMPTLNAEQLNNFAQSLNGVYINARLDGADVKQLSDWLTTKGDATETELMGDSWQDVGPYLALVLILPVLLMFRHGMALAALICIVPLVPATTHAAVWQTADQQAMDAFAKGDFKAAADGFERSDWKAAADYRAGDFDAALKGFEADNSAQGLYNQGNALMQLGDYDQADKRYQQALEKDPEFEHAKANQALAKALAEQKRQQENASQNSDSTNQGDQSQNGQSQNSQSQENESQQNPSQKNSDDKQSPREQDKSPSPQSDAKQSGGENAQHSKDPQQQNQQRENQQQGGSASEDAQQAKNEAPMSATPNASEGAASAGNKDEKDQQDDEQAPQSSSIGQAPSTEPAPEDEQSAQTAVQQPSQNEGNELPPDMMRALQAVDDDPSVLLRNKMQLEYQLRRERGEHRQDKQKW